MAWVDSRIQRKCGLSLLLVLVLALRGFSLGTLVSPLPKHQPFQMPIQSGECPQSVLCTTLALIINKVNYCYYYKSDHSCSGSAIQLHSCYKFFFPCCLQYPIFLCAKMSSVLFLMIAITRVSSAQILYMYTCSED